MLEIREKSLLNIKVVLLLNSHKHSKKGLKMDPEWTGPYVIHEVLSKGTFHLCDPQSSNSDHNSLPVTPSSCSASVNDGLQDDSKVPHSTCPNGISKRPSSPNEESSVRYRTLMANVCMSPTT
jgi:hypothetical protein